MSDETPGMEMLLRIFRGQVKTVFDIGVRQGTPELYSAFPAARFILVDPQIGGEEWLLHRPQDYIFVGKGLGPAKGEAEFREAKAMSTFHQRTHLTAVANETLHMVEVDTLDNLIDEFEVEGRIGLKIDTEGDEVNIMSGLVKHIDRVDFVVCEGSIRRRFKHSYDFSDLVVAMFLRGFRFYNFLNPPVIRPRFYDVVFLRKGHPLFR